MLSQPIDDLDKGRNTDTRDAPYGFARVRDVLGARHKVLDGSKDRLVRELLGILVKATPDDKHGSHDGDVAGAFVVREVLRTFVVPKRGLVRFSNQRKRQRKRRLRAGRVVP